MSMTRLKTTVAATFKVKVKVVFYNEEVEQIGIT